MTAGKMTPEELNEAKRALHAGDSSEADWTDTWGDRVFAHIAAVEAERDKAELSAKQWERDALRERVTALEAENSDLRSHARTCQEDANLQISRLAAIRQRADSWRASHVGTRYDAGRVALGFVLSGNGAPSELDGLPEPGETRPAAGVSTGDGKAMCTHCRKRLAVCIGEYESSTGNPEPACGECCGHGNEDGWCSPISVEARGTYGRVPEYVPVLPVDAEADSAMSAWIAEQSKPTRAEPTTAEAFATVRKAMKGDAGINEREAGRSALSLLERCMGAVWRTFVEEMAHWPTCPSGNDFSDAGWARCDCHMGQVRAVLTDAPAVFTLGEIEVAMRTAGVAPLEREETLDALRSAMSTTEGSK